MRTRNSSSRDGPDESALGNTRVHDPQQQQQPLLPPPTTRTQPERRPPPAPPPVRRTHPPPPVSHSQPPPAPPLHPNNVVTSPRQLPLSPTRIPPPQQQQPQRRHLSPPPQDEPHSTERLRPAAVLTSPPPPPPLPPPPHMEVTATHPPDGLLLPTETLPPPMKRWILKVRLPTTTTLNRDDGISTQMTPIINMKPSSVIRKIQMTTPSSTTTMDTTTLSNCLQQCLNYYPSGSSSSSSNNQVAGLFCETSQVFYSLAHVLSWNEDEIAERQASIYAVELPVVVTTTSTTPPPPADDDEGFWRGWYDFITDEISALIQSILSNLYILIPIAMAILLYYQYNTVSDGVLMTYTTVYSTMIEQPLRDIYHYGPWFIGWEGDDISTICARITYHGDAQFWLRNMSECERIYSAKEHAFIRIVLPFIYMMCAVLFVLTLRFLIQEYQQYQFQLQNHHRNPLERDMADLYHSFHVILRQILQVHNEQRPSLQQKRRPKQN